MKVLIVAAHPDDETLGAGGVMAKHIANRDSVSVVIVAQGITSRKGNNEDYSAELTKLRKESKNALSKLGVKEVRFLDFPDNAMDGVPLLEVVKSLEKVITEEKPEIVYTHHWGDLNIDHRITSNAVITACRPIGSTVRRILCFEVLSSTEWNRQTSDTVFTPNVFTDITPFIDRKIAALKEYTDEMRAYPHPRSLEGIESLAKTRGLVIGVKSAEAFELVREINR